MFWVARWGGRRRGRWPRGGDLPVWRSAATHHGTSRSREQITQRSTQETTPKETEDEQLPHAKRTHKDVALLVSPSSLPGYSARIHISSLCLLGLEGGPQLNLVADVCVLRAVEKLVPAGEYLKLKNLHALLQLDFSELKELHQQASRSTVSLLSGRVPSLSRFCLFFRAFYQHYNPHCCEYSKCPSPRASFLKYFLQLFTLRLLLPPVCSIVNVSCSEFI